MQKKHYPLVDIILATYNGESYLRDQLDSIIGQTYANWKLYIRDDGSCDATLNIITDYQLRFPDKIQFVKDGDRNLGSSGNFMRLLEIASADYIMLCDQDDIWKKTKIEKSLVRILEMETQFGTNKPLMVFTDLTVVDANNNILHKSFWETQRLSPDVTRKTYQIVAQSSVTGCTMIFNRNVLRYALPQAVKELQHDHWITICTTYFGHVDYLRESTIFYRVHGKNDVGMKQPTISYLMGSIKNIIYNVRAWKDIKKRTDIRFSIFAVIAFKLLFNVKRVFLQVIRSKRATIPAGHQ